MMTNVVALNWSYVKNDILSDIHHIHLKIIMYSSYVLTPRLLDLLAGLMRPKTISDLKRPNRMIASMITRIVFCKFEWL